MGNGLPERQIDTAKAVMKQNLSTQFDHAGMTKHPFLACTAPFNRPADLTHKLERLENFLRSVAHVASSCPRWVVFGLAKMGRRAPVHLRPL